MRAARTSPPLFNKTEKSSRRFHQPRTARLRAGERQRCLVCICDTVERGDLGSALVEPPAGVLFEGEWPWWSEVPINEIPGEVGTHIRLGSAPGVVVYMTSILAYSTAISFDVVRFSDGDEVSDPAESPWGDLRFWVTYADGSESRNDQAWEEDAVDPPGPVVLVAEQLRAAGELGVVDRCRFLGASADDLHAINDESIDVVTTRSVLIYVSRKREAFCEFARVLRPGGRISLYEPINRFGRRDANTWMGYDLSPLDDIGAKLRAVYDALQPPDTDPMLDFDERDLIRLAQDAGFFPIQLRLEADIKPIEPRPWDAFLHSAGNPNIPTFAEAIQQSLTAAERQRLSAHLRPQVEHGLGEWRMAAAYLAATKPGTAG